MRLVNSHSLGVYYVVSWPCSNSIFSYSAVQALYPMWIVGQECAMLSSLNVPVHTTELLCWASSIAQDVYQPSRTINNRMTRLHWNTMKKQKYKPKPHAKRVTKCYEKI